jgi:hypothetical protein
MNANSGDGYYEVFWPRAPKQIGQKALAPRLETLSGKTIVQLWDYLFLGDEVYRFLEEGLAARFPGVRFVSWREFGDIHGANQREILAGLPARLKELGADAAISCMGC